MSRLDTITNWDTLAEQSSFRVKLLAKECRVSSRQLQRYFRQKFGSSPHTWMALRRLQKVRPFLSQGDLVKEVAQKAGFSKQGNFTRQYKRYYKRSPAADFPWAPQFIPPKDSPERLYG